MSMQSDPLDSLIVGQGLAGSLLAWELVRRGKRVMLVDPGGDSTSRIAGGIINPLTGRRFARPPQLEEMISAASNLYGEIEDALRFIVFQECRIMRLIQDDLESAQLDRRMADPTHAPYFEERLAANSLGCGLADPRGAAVVRGGRLDMARLLERMREYFSDSGRLQERQVDPTELRLEGGLVKWGRCQARQLVFCEGWRVRDNPWFHWLPVRPSRGEILTVRIGRELPQGVISAGKWLIPLGQGRYRLGATYQRDATGPEPTEAGRDELLDALANLFSDPPEVEVLAHEVGVRPGKTDHYPVLGRHPEHPELAAFNGLGSRGALMAPYYARLLADHLEDGATLPEAADVRHWYQRRAS
jgi:glycine/D-amino acid oxidase-like deaminating enzyme